MIASRLLDRGEHFRILVRPASDYRALVAAGAEAFPGDLKDAATLAAACAGADVVVTTATSGSRGGLDTPKSVDLQGNRDLIDAARAAGVRQFMFVSTIAADKDSPIPLLRAKAVAEAHLRRSVMPYTILASHTLMNVRLLLVVAAPAAAGQPVTLVGRRKHSFVAARDLAAFAAAAVHHPRATNRRMLIGGPEPVSWRDGVACYERVLGRLILMETAAPGDLLPRLPLVPGLAEVVTSMVPALDSFDLVIDMHDGVAA